MPMEKTLKPCTRCGAQPALKPVSIVFQAAYHYVCPCGRAGSARLTEAAAEEAWIAAQEPVRRRGR